MVSVNPSTIWLQLTTPNPPAGGIPFIGTDQQSPIIDVTNLYWDQVNDRMHIGLDQASAVYAAAEIPTSKLNVYGAIKSFATQAEQLTSGRGPAEISVGSMRGSLLAPAISVDEDLLGSFSAYGYTGTTPSSQVLGGLYFYADGATAANLGGKAVIKVKADNGALADAITITPDKAVTFAGNVNVAGIITIPLAVLANPTITGTVAGGATYSDITLSGNTSLPSGGRINSSGGIGINTTVTASADSKLMVHTGINRNLAVRGPINLVSGISLQSIQDDMTSDANFEIYAGSSSIRFTAGAGVTVSNNLTVNSALATLSDITVGTGGGARRVDINGGTGSGNGSLIGFGKNSAFMGYIGTVSAITGGNSDAIGIYGINAGLKFYGGFTNYGELSTGGVWSLGGASGSESLRVNAVAGADRHITTAGSNGGNPTIGVSAGSLAISAALVLSQTTLLSTSVALTNGAGANTGTLNNSPAVGNPTKWIPIVDNGTTRYIPAW